MRWLPHHRHIPILGILHTKRPGNGVKLFNSSGRFKLRIDSTLARWTVKIIQITPEEAEQYTPRKET